MVGVCPLYKAQLQFAADNEWLLLLRSYGILGTLLFVCAVAGPHVIHRPKAAGPSVRSQRKLADAVLIASAVYMIPAAVFQSMTLMPLVLVILGSPMRVPAPMPSGEAEAAETRARAVEDGRASPETYVCWHMERAWYRSPSWTSTPTSGATPSRPPSAQGQPSARGEEKHSTVGGDGTSSLKTLHTSLQIIVRNTHGLVDAPGATRPNPQQERALDFLESIQAWTATSTIQPYAPSISPTHRLSPHGLELLPGIVRTPNRPMRVNRIGARHALSCSRIRGAICTPGR